MKVHFIAIGGSAMHNLAIALKDKGYEVTGSDDEIFEPSKSRLDRKGILPTQIGWDTDLIHNELDAVILGMHARVDNPELKKAQELGLEIYSYPEFLYAQSKDKKRIVIGGSHGKTTITSMILHVMNELNIETDYMVGAQLEGFDCMVKLTDAPVMVLEGDEYLSSPIDRRPKFHWYKPDVALLSGVAWDHINVFPTFENYVEQFEIFVQGIEDGGSLVYFEPDEHLRNIAAKYPNVKQFPYDVPEYEVGEGKTTLKSEGKEYELQIFGRHNLSNLYGAKNVLNQIGVSDDEFYTAIQSFKGAAKRLELIAENDSCKAYKDFAHSPSKLKATVNAVKEQFPDRKLVACMELHTFSSLKKDFLPQYENCLAKADEAYVYFDPHVIEHKKLEPITKEFVKECFATDNVKILNARQEVEGVLKNTEWKNASMLLMSSGNFGGINLNEFAKELLS
ncbi:MAG: Mur ligase domain-containing protein [Crocinitomicaceae bacterium]|nr:Mur ligase domain-containing protein [Crocinitomicaceae bacterium]